MLSFSLSPSSVSLLLAACCTHTTTHTTSSDADAECGNSEREIERGKTLSYLCSFGVYFWFSPFHRPIISLRLKTAFFFLNLFGSFLPSTSSHLQQELNEMSRKKRKKHRRRGARVAILQCNFVCVYFVVVVVATLLFGFRSSNSELNYLWN